MGASRRCTPEEIERVRHDYEETDKQVADIAAEHVLHKRTVHKWAVRHGWRKRSERAPPAVRAGSNPAPTEAAGPAVKGSIADRLERQLDVALARLERICARDLPQRPADALSLTRTLERLTDALLKVRRLRASDTNMAGRNDYDDEPRDADEFRRALARRIEAFMRSRTGGDIPAAGAAPDSA